MARYPFSALGVAGVPTEQAGAVVRIIVKSHAELVTRDNLDTQLEKGLSPIRAEFAVAK